MLYNIVTSVIGLAFLLAIILEIIVISYVLKPNTEEKRTKVSKPRKISVNRKDRKKFTQEMKKFETLLNNIDAYDGTDYGQKDVE